MSAGIRTLSIEEKVRVIVMTCDCCGRKAKYFPAYLAPEDRERQIRSTASDVTDDDVSHWLRVSGSEGRGDLDFCEACKDAVVASAKKMVRPEETPPVVSYSYSACVCPEPSDLVHVCIKVP